MNFKLYYGGNIITLDENKVNPEAIITKESTIIYVGSIKECELMSSSTDDIEYIDLDGKAIMPGFYESHGHLTFNSTIFMHMDFANEKYSTFEEAYELIRDVSKKLPKDSFVICANYDESKVSDKRLFKREDLDGISSTQRIFVGHVSSHCAFLNTRALKEEEGLLEEHNEGRLDDGDLVNYFIKYIPKPTEEYMFSKILEMQEECISAGVTTMSDAGFLGQGFMVLDQLKKMNDKNLLKCNIAKSISYCNMDEEEFFMKLKKIENEYSFLHNIKTIKTFYDGSIQPGSAYLSQAYSNNKQENRDLNYKGHPTMSKDQLQAQVENAYKNGYSITVHTNGDAAMDDVMDAVEIAHSKYPKVDLSSSLIHAQTIRQDQLDRAKKLDIIPSFFNIHVHYWAQGYCDYTLGKERGRRVSPLKEAVDRDMVFTLHCDAPVIKENPLLAIDTAVNRVSIRGEVIGEEFKIDPLEAIKAYTLYPAIQTGEESIKGSIEIGKQADFVILSDNPITCESRKIKDIVVRETIVKGMTVYSA